MEDELFSYFHAISELEGLDVYEELSNVFDDISEQHNGAQKSGLVSEQKVTGKGLVKAVKFEENSELLNYNFPEPITEFASIVEKAEKVAEANRSFTSGGLPDGFEQLSDEGPRGFDETSFTSTKNYGNSSLSISYGERTSFGFGGSETARIEVKLEGLLEKEYDNSWSLQ